MFWMVITNPNNISRYILFTLVSPLTREGYWTVEGAALSKLGYNEISNLFTNIERTSCHSILSKTRNIQVWSYQIYHAYFGPHLQISRNKGKHNFKRNDNEFISVPWFIIYTYIQQFKRVTADLAINWCLRIHHLDEL